MNEFFDVSILSNRGIRSDPAEESWFFEAVGVSILSNRGIRSDLLLEKS